MKWEESDPEKIKETVNKKRCGVHVQYGLQPPHRTFITDRVFVFFCQKKKGSEESRRG
jgi:hypothetical protein